MKRWMIRLAPVLLLEIAFAALWVRGLTWAMAFDLEWRGRLYHLGSGRGIAFFQTESRTSTAFNFESIGNEHHAGQHWTPFFARNLDGWEIGLPYWMLIVLAALPFVPYVKIGQQLLRRKSR